MWPTARSRDYKDTPGMNLYRGYSPTLPVQVFREERNARFWRTPDAHCDRGAKARETYIRKSEKGLPISINDQATHGDFRTIDERSESAKGQLNPEWVEQLMGFERGWTEV